MDLAFKGNAGACKLSGCVGRQDKRAPSLDSLADNKNIDSALEAASIVASVALRRRDKVGKYCV